MRYSVLPLILKTVRIPTESAIFFRSFLRTEQKRNTPETRERNKRVNDAAYKCVLTAEKPGNEVELEETDASPVQCTDDYQYKGNSV